MMSRNDLEETIEYISYFNLILSHNFETINHEQKSIFNLLDINQMQEQFIR